MRNPWERSWKQWMLLQLPDLSHTHIRATALFADLFPSARGSHICNAALSSWADYEEMGADMQKAPLLPLVVVVVCLFVVILCLFAVVSCHIASALVFLLIIVC